MSLLRLDIYNVRNIRQQTLIPSDTLNFIFGKNASGKSALIEAIFLLGRGKSFRTSIIKSVITFDQTELIVSAQIQEEQYRSISLGIRMDGKTVDIRKNQLPSLNRSDLAYSLPLQIIHPKSFELLDASGQIRREFMDWGIFNHEKSFLQAWRNYKKALSQRNALLKNKAVTYLQPWNNELVNYGTIVYEFRMHYLAKLKPVLDATIKQFLNFDEIDLRLISGWDETLTLQHSIEEDLERDLRDGYTHSGPHRSDFQLLINHKPVKEVASRGQLKILVTCLKLAQIQLMYKEQDFHGCILIDDFAAELDLENRAKIVNFLSDMKCQVFITATEKMDFGDLGSLKNYKMFHVKHGEFNLIDVPCETS
jgi:DNA replication and repair protein RecF